MMNHDGTPVVLSSLISFEVGRWRKLVPLVFLLKYASHTQLAQGRKHETALF